MLSFFVSILEISATAAFVALVVLLFRLALKSSPRWITCLLWGLVALRLIAPTLPESKFSLIPDSSVKISNSAQNITLSEPRRLIPRSESDTALSVSAPDSQVMIPEYTEEESYESLASALDYNKLTKVSFCVWTLGAGAMLIYGIISYIATRVRFRDAVLLRDNIRQSEKVDSPFVMGFLRPQIYISYHLDRKTRKQVLLHEQAHISRLDHIWKPIGYFLLCLHWFNPFLWISYILFCRDIEVACDEKVIKHYKMKQKKAYATALLNCKSTVKTFSASPIAFGEIGVGVRIKKTLKYKRPAVFVCVAGVVLTVALSLCLLTNPVSAHEIQENTDFSTGVKADSSNEEETSPDFTTESVTNMVDEQKTEPSAAVETEPVTEAPVEYSEEYEDTYYNAYDYSEDYQNNDLSQVTAQGADFLSYYLSVHEPSDPWGNPIGSSNNHNSSLGWKSDNLIDPRENDIVISWDHQDYNQSVINSRSYLR